MPEYLYFNPSNESEIISVIQRMSEPHVYFKDNVEWKRLFTTPKMSIDSYNIGTSKEDFMRATKKRCSYGDMQDLSKEMAEKRGEKSKQDQRIETKDYIIE